MLYTYIHMKPFVMAIRAVGTEFAARKARGLGLAVAIGAVVLSAVVLWATTINVWWWVFGVVVIGLDILLLVLAVGTWLAIRMLRPSQTKTQREAVTRFADKLERTADTLQTPPLFILLRVLRDIIWPRGTSFIAQIATDSTSLHRDLVELQQRFREDH